MKNKIYIYNTNNNSSPLVFDWCDKTLQEHITRYRRQEDTLNSFCAWKLVAMKLQQYGMALPLQVEFLPNGKPKVLGTNKVISISHSAEIIALAISDEQIGIDIERIRDINYSRLLERICNEIETENINALPTEERIERFYEIWTAKEAYSKYTGNGLLKIKNITVLASTVGSDGLITQYHTTRHIINGSAYRLAIASQNAKYDIDFVDNLT
ncbi:MAG: 4'-phosphopantetheinyl transferase superfamily protein [Clostridia bacterium]